MHGREVVVLERDGVSGGGQRVAGAGVLGRAGVEQRLHGAVDDRGTGSSGGGARRGGAVRRQRRGGRRAARGVGRRDRDRDGRQAPHVGRGAGRVRAQRGHAQVVVRRGVAGRAH